MSDERLRTLERAWKESGDDEAAEAYLNERVRHEGWPWRRIVEHVVRQERVLAASFETTTRTRLEIAGVHARPVTAADIIRWLDGTPEPEPEPEPPRHYRLTYRAPGAPPFDGAQRRMLERMVERARPVIEQRRLLGGLAGERQEQRLTLQDSAFILIALRVVDAGTIAGDIEVLNTPQGRALQTCIDDGTPMRLAPITFDGPEGPSLVGVDVEIGVPNRYRYR